MKNGIVIMDIDALEQEDVEKLEHLGFVVIKKRPMRHLQVFYKEFENGDA